MTERFLSLKEVGERRGDSVGWVEVI